MRSFYVLMIHADYKKPGFKYNLVFGQRLFDKKGKLIKFGDDKKKDTPPTNGPNYIGRDGRPVSQQNRQNPVVAAQGGPLRQTRGQAAPNQAQNGQNAQIAQPSQNGTVQGQNQPQTNLLQNAGGAMTRENNFDLSLGNKKKDLSNLKYVSVNPEKIKI